MLKMPLNYPEVGSAVEKAKFISEYREVDYNLYSSMCRYFVEDVALRRTPITGKGRNKTEQDVGTPVAFLRCVQELFGRIAFDLAASKRNHVTPRYYTKEDNALHHATQWPKYRLRREEGVCDTIAPWLWLNPPFSDIGPWLERCQAEKESGRNILVLIPASVGTRWWSKWVDIKDGPAWTPVGRMKFVGHTAPFPRDLALLVYSTTWEEEMRMSLSSKELTTVGSLSPRYWRSKERYMGQWNWQVLDRLLLDNVEQTD